MTKKTTILCSAEISGYGYWTCDVHGGCPDCRRLAYDAQDEMQLALWNAQRSSPHRYS